MPDDDDTTNSKGAIGRYVISPDTHVPYHDIPAFNCLLGAIKVVRPDGFIDIGDFWEGEAASHWNWRKRKRPPLEYQLREIDRELILANKWMDKRDAVLDACGVNIREYIQGNHDDWLDRLVEENPFLEHTKSPCGTGYKFRDAFRLEERGYRFHPLGKYFKLGKLAFYHGHHYGGIHHASNHLRKLGANVMYGHRHDVQEDSISHLDGKKAAWCIGCLKSFKHEHGNEFMGRRAHNWAHAFAIVDFWRGGNFTVDVVRITGGRCSVWGHLIDGNKKKG